MRFRSKPLIALSIVLVLASALGGWHAPDDRDEYAVAAVHQHADHDARFATPTQPAPEHCAFCHWLRAFGSGANTTTAFVTPVVVGRLLSSAIAETVHSTDRLVRSSRGPPLA